MSDAELDRFVLSSGESQTPSELKNGGARTPRSKCVIQTQFTMLSLLGRKLACAPVAALRTGATPTLLSASRFAAKKPSFVRFGGSDHGHRTDGITHAGLTIYPPKKAHVIEAKLWGALAWFWIFYQLEANWDVMLVRLFCTFFSAIYFDCALPLLFLNRFRSTLAFFSLVGSHQSAHYRLISCRVALFCSCVLFQGFRAPWEHRGDVSLMEDDELPDGTTPGGHKHHH